MDSVSGCLAIRAMAKMITHASHTRQRTLHTCEKTTKREREKSERERKERDGYFAFMSFLRWIDGAYPWGANVTKSLCMRKRAWMKVRRERVHSKESKEIASNSCKE